MNLTPQNAALLSVLNSARLSLTEEVKKERIAPGQVMRRLLEVHTYCADSGQVPEIEQETLTNVTKLLSSTFIDDNHQGHKYKVPANTFSDFLKSVEPAVIKEQLKEKQPATNQQAPPPSNPVVGRACFEPKNKYGRYMKEEKKQEQERPKEAQFVSALGLVGTAQLNSSKVEPANNQQQLQGGKYPSVRKKFVPPFKKNQGEREPVVQDIEDTRLKNLEPRMVEMILSQVLDSQQPIKWKDIAGLSFAKKTIYEMIVWPMLRPDIFTGLRSPPKGILLFGPPGTGKTLIGKAIASESNSTFFSISASSLTSKWVGESEKMVRTLFAVAKVKQPSVIFIDEIDSLLCARSEKDDDSTRRIKTEFLVQLDGAKSMNDDKVLIIGATNRPEQLDEAVKRRFVKRLYIPLPNREGRRQLFSHTAQNSAFELSEADIEEIASLTRGYSGADLHNLCTQASYIPLRKLQGRLTQISFEAVPATTVTDLKQALKLVRPTVNQEQLKGYLDWNKNFGSYQFSNEGDLED